MISKNYNHISFIGDNRPNSRYGVEFFEENTGTLAEIALKIKNFLKETIK